MGRSNFRTIFSLFLIFSSLIFVILLIDSTFFNSIIFSDVSSYFGSYLQNSFGDFKMLFITFGLIIGVFFLIPTKTNTKVFLTIGYSLLIMFLPAFFETLELSGLSGGYFGMNMSNMFTSLGYVNAILLYFFWFFSSIFILAFPYRFSLVSNIVRAFSKNDNIRNQKVKTNINNNRNNNKPTVHRNRPANYTKSPWLSRVIFDNSANRIEIPVFPTTSDNIKTFKLVNSVDNVDEYQEILDLPLRTNQPIKVEYYDKLKTNWPPKWQKNNVQEKPVSVKQNIDEDIFEKSKQKLLKKKLKEKHKNIRSQEIENDPYIEELQVMDESINKDNIYNNNDDKGFLPESSILKSSQKLNTSLFKAEENESAMILEETLQEFGIEAQVIEIIHGPVVTMFKLIPAPGIKLSKIEGLSNNLALRLAAKSIRIIAPIPGESAVGIEIPNRIKMEVKFKEIVNSEIFAESQNNIPIGLGKDIYGNIIIIDLFKMPHILIAGATGSGKSVCVNSILSSILFSKSPEDVRLVLIDPKIIELKPFNNIPHLLTPVITDPKQAMRVLKYLIFEMERRYTLLDQMGARDIVEYRKKRERKKYPQLEQLPFIVTIVDEFADLMSTSGKEAEYIFAKLAAKSRAVGIHLVLATQRPSADVITGLIKANIPARIAFQVISLQDSRIILDLKGAEKLLGMGDMLYLSPTHPYPIRLQGALLTLEEVELIAEHWKSMGEPDYVDIEEILKIDEDENDYVDGNNVDPLFEEALEIIYNSQKASASYLQRRLGIGYNRAARIVEEMERMGIVGPQNGSKPREIIGSAAEYHLHNR